MSVPMPGTALQYVTGGPAALWFDTVQLGGRLTASYQSGPVPARPGTRLTENWNQYPLHPQPDAQSLTGAAARVLPEAPSAYRIGNELVLRATPFSDNTPGHSGLEYAARGVTGRYAVYQDGTEIASGNPFTTASPDRDGGLASVTGTEVQLAAARPSVIRLMLTTSQPVTTRLSDRATTVWTWRSHRDPGARVPSGWFCQAKLLEPPTRSCAVQPMLEVDYHVCGLAQNGLTAPGRQVIGLDVSHIQPGGRARITAVAVEVSADGGRSWHRAAVRAARPGQFTVTFAGHARTEITLRVAARDAAGGSITETIRDAYGVRS
jgi:hypothetical protein